MVGNRPSARKATNGHRASFTNGNDLPPPSTYAAQLVRQHAQDGRKTSLEGSLGFAELLHEILRPDAIPDPDPDVNIKAVRVVIEAGLDVLSATGRIQSEASLQKQTTDSLAVIQKLVKQQPELLFHGQPNEGHAPPLVVLIFAKIATATPHAKALHPSISELLLTILQTTQASLQHWQRAGNVLRMYQDTVDDLLESLQESTQVAQGSMQLVVNVPATRSITRLHSTNGLTTTLSAALQYRVVEVDDAVELVHLLLAAITRLFTHQRQDHMNPHILSPRRWTADTLSDLTKVMMRRYVGPTARPIIVMALTMNAELLLDFIQHAGEQVLTLDKSLLDCLTVLMDAAIKHQLSSELQDRLAGFLRASVTMPSLKQAPMLSKTANHYDSVENPSHITADLLTALQLVSQESATRSDHYHDHQNGQQLTHDVHMPGRLTNQHQAPELSVDSAFAALHKIFPGITVRTSRKPPVPSRATYDVLSGDERERLWSLLITIPCLAAGANTEQPCDICGPDLRYIRPQLTNSEEHTWIEGGHFGAFLLKLLALPSVQESERDRVAATLSVGAYAAHTTFNDHLNLGKSKLAEWCLRALTRSSRGLRFVAGRALTAFLRDDIEMQLRDSNRRLVMEYLRSLSDVAKPDRLETLIFTWGQVAIVCGDRERNLALLQLVDYLGHSNSMVAAVAFHELEQIAAVLKQNGYDLFRPYWKTVAVSLVRDLFNLPQKIQAMVDYLSTTVPRFLVHTQTATVPYLILAKRADVLRKIALSRGSGTTIQDIFLQPKTTLAAVFSLLLMQPTDDRLEFLVAILNQVDPGWKKHDVMNLISLEPSIFTVELLKTAGDDDQDKHEQAIEAIHVVAAVAKGKPATSASTIKASSYLGPYFESDVLGIMAIFSETIERKGSNALHQDKVRSLLAVQAMVSLAQEHITIAAPQIRACLQSAIDQGNLIDPAISAWLSLLSALRGEDSVPLLDHLFSIIVQHWSQMSPTIQQKTYDTVAWMLKTHNDLVRDQVIMVPSLASVPLMAKFGAEIDRLKSGEPPDRFIEAFVERLQNENAAIVSQAGRELQEWLETNQEYMHNAVVSEPPAPIVAVIVRSLLDVCVKYSTSRPDISENAAICLGAIGAIDPHRIEANVAETQVLVLSNFDLLRECMEWLAYLFSEVLVPAFMSSTNAKAQGFLAWVMQELLAASGIKGNEAQFTRASQAEPASEMWSSMSENVQSILTPFRTSRYRLTSNIAIKSESYPLFHATIKHNSWLRRWVCDMLWRAKGDNPKLYFSILARIVKDHDPNIAKQLLPYAALNIVLAGDSKEVEAVANELLVVLSTESRLPAEQEILRLCSENVFAILDYMTRWLQEKKRTLAATKQAYAKAGHAAGDLDTNIAEAQIATVETLIASIPANIIAQRAIECGSYARALFHWESFIREQRLDQKTDTSTRDAMYTRLQSIYSEIDEPDGLDGIAAQINILTPEQQAFQHLRAGRWSAAQSWYEIELANSPQAQDVQTGLLTCLKESGQANQVLRLSKDMAANESDSSSTDAHRQRLLSFGVEAAWGTGALDHIRVDVMHALESSPAQDFNMAISKILLGLREGASSDPIVGLHALRSTISRSLTTANASSLAACHPQLLHLHALYELEHILTVPTADLEQGSLETLAASFDRRLAVLGSSVPDKQFVLGLRRAALFHIGTPAGSELGKAWLMTARLARKADVANTAHYAVLRAADCGDGSSKIEQARLLWKYGQHRQAIHSLQGAIDSDAFAAYETERRTETLTGPDAAKQNMLSARAHLLLAKWLDASGQSQSLDVTIKYQYAARQYPRWEKGHYYLGKHYNALLEAERAQPHNKQKDSYITGELTKLVVENYLRSIPFGSKYWYETIPKLLTLWLDLGMECMTKPKDLPGTLWDKRILWLNHIHLQINKYFDRVQRYVFYNALPQMISRVSHPNTKVVEILSHMIFHVTEAHAAQALWTVIPVARATAPDRAARGKELVAKLKAWKGRKSDNNRALELRALVMQGTKLQDGLLNASEMAIEGKASSISLSRDLRFSSSLAPSKLVVPFQHLLTPNVPTVQDSAYIRAFKAFAQTPVTIVKFLDEVLVMNSIQRPRKLTVLGSDGNQYGLLCKPKDDLRKDQRLMEFNTMINRALRRHPDSAKRRLYIRTYGVTPLSEESGTIEWVENIKPLRDILLKLYSRKGITPNYGQLRNLLNEASAHPSNYRMFSAQVLPNFPPVLHEWFTETFASAGAWFASRLRFARSAAVMSVVGHVLGLGDRHGENILLEESGGGVLHVDFNCLFDKGLTFEKPELVPFRLTHNMVDAMGGPVLGAEGPFRRTAEITLGILRVNADTLMNVLETFLHDPTTDFIGKKKSRAVMGVPETPAEVLESVRLKLRGFLGGESVPLGVEGHVAALISMATDEANLCRMYFGWCAFL